MHKANGRTYAVCVVSDTVLIYSLQYVCCHHI